MQENLTQQLISNRTIRTKQNIDTRNGIPNVENDFGAKTESLNKKKSDVGAVAGQRDLTESPEILALKAKLNNLKAESERLQQQQHDENEKLISKHTKDIERIQNETAQTIKQMETMEEKKVKELEAENAQLLQYQERLDEKLKLLNSEKLKTEQNYNKALTLIEELKTEKDKLLNDDKELTKLSEQLAEEQKSQNIEIEKLQRELEVQKQLVITKEALIADSLTLETVLNKALELNANTENVSTQLESIKQELLNMKTHLDLTKQELEKTQQQLAEKTKNVKILDSEIQALTKKQEDIASKTVELSTQETAVVELVRSTEIRVQNISKKIYETKIEPIYNGDDEEKEDLDYDILNIIDNIDIFYNNENMDILDIIDNGDIIDLF